TDSGFWLGLCDKKDQYHEKSKKIFEQIKYHNLYLPWPVLYEVLRTKFIKNNLLIKTFESYLKVRNLKLEFLSDLEFRNLAYNNVLSIIKERKRTFSLVDAVIREMLAEEKLVIHYLITFNTGDFADICKRRNITLVNNPVSFT
ncbi:MAG: hypothetical protein OEZ36_13835, partial [Spirochaetota bacterium]|nr:hypothetical protein [Spirochaetota bacterium]